jgi:hypothetical protein
MMSFARNEIIFAPVSMKRQKPHEVNFFMKSHSDFIKKWAFHPEWVKRPDVV